MFGRPINSKALVAAQPRPASHVLAEIRWNAYQRTAVRRHSQPYSIGAHDDHTIGAHGHRNPSAGAREVSPCYARVRRSKHSSKIGDGHCVAAVGAAGHGVPKLRCQAWAGVIAPPVPRYVQEPDARAETGKNCPKKRVSSHFCFASKPCRPRHERAFL